MGDVTQFGFAALALFGVGLLGVGAVRRRRKYVFLGAALLVALAGAWLFGLLGLGLGALLVGFAYRQGDRR